MMATQNMMPYEIIPVLCEACTHPQFVEYVEAALWEQDAEALVFSIFDQIYHFGKRGGKWYMWREPKTERTFYRITHGQTLVVG